MKKLAISALLLLVASVAFTSCSSTRETTSVPQDVNSSTTRTYSK
jgi:hypothetical protein